MHIKKDKNYLGFFSSLVTSSISKMGLILYTVGSPGEGVSSGVSLSANK